MGFKFQNKQVWAAECIRLGAVNHLAEKTTYADLDQRAMKEYAVGTRNERLFGMWDPISGKGIIYNRPLIEFSTKDRQFVQEKLSVYAKG